MVKKIAAVQSLNPQGVGVRVEFAQLADRYCHKIYVVDGEQSVLVMESEDLGSEDLESEHGDSVGSACPAYQDLNVQEIADRPVAALVGMSGDCHWSLIVEPTTEPEQTGILFDAACRMKAAVGSVRSVYKMALDAELGKSETTHEIDTPLGKLALVAQQIKEDAEGTPPLEVAYHERKLLVRREVVPSARLPATVRWRYRVEFRSD
ncbi:hypothetical protein [Adhaeretor mobilis]|uniref:hypothetical protein n=1 Tax=Adhaeretor mobilis TaxID=1930276 RepID=UPI0011A74AA8|nr:hypothetical protein [Adhaeretor mobilis]